MCRRKLANISIKDRKPLKLKSKSGKLTQHPKAPVKMSPIVLYLDKYTVPVWRCAWDF